MLWPLRRSAPSDERSVDEGRDPRALGPEEHQAEADHGDMHADGGDEQDEHRGVGQGLERQPVDQRPHRRDGGQGDERIGGEPQLLRRQPDHGEQERDWKDEVADGHPAELSGAQRLALPDEVEREGAGRQDRQQPDRAGRLAGFERGEGQRAPGDEFALRDEDHPGHREEQDQRDAEQSVNRSIDDFVLQQEQNDGRAHGCRALSGRVARKPDIGSSGAVRGPRRSGQGRSVHLPPTILISTRERLSRPAWSVGEKL